MSIEKNKKDFENALEKLETYLDFAHPDLVELIEAVSAKYNTHYQGDIESLMDKVSELENEVESLKQDIEDYEDELSGAK